MKRLGTRALAVALVVWAAGMTVLVVQERQSGSSEHHRVVALKAALARDEKASAQSSSGTSYFVQKVLTLQAQLGGLQRALQAQQAESGVGQTSLADLNSLSQEVWTLCQRLESRGALSVGDCVGIGG